MSVTHATFSLERTYPVPPEKAFAAWSDPAAKARWFGSGETHELDFRVGGTELTTGHTKDGHSLAAVSVYHDIVPLGRIVYSTTLTGDDTLATVSVTTIEFHADGEGTRLVLTEQGTFLDGAEEPAWRERGTRDWLAKLGKELVS
jgi:uncharacterized protein YndB with AHSA1/START domain